MNTIPINDYPVSIQINLSTGEFNPCMELQDRKLSSLSKMFYDQKAVEEIIKAGDRLVYQIRYYPFITSKSDMALGTTMILPGTIGGEYHMTKGHFHEADNQPEIYHCVTGEGALQMMDINGEYHCAHWTQGTITHIPPQYAHRVINTGKTPLVFVASFHVAAGHVYGPIESKGFKYLWIEKDGKPTEVLSPKWA
jgi:glucose-6-phosphate isomerase